ncbi:uncharacterized protein LOC110709111 [Chenopodium quinoa]|uniref:uncharacterized protein LOC110709111 n=1 Tax=Chenopodium quinoa TaxID=63459 RepID=UPI000B77A2B0|nr:uncharacterized protein LOC110709111 [Chenopodium quinoa]
MMAEITFKLSFFTVFISDLLMLTQSGDIFAKKLNRINVEDQDELESGSLLMQMLIEAETKTLGLAKDVMEIQTGREDANSKDQLKCIPCGAACISSRNCCRNCYCLIWELVNLDVFVIDHLINQLSRFHYYFTRMSP